MWDTTAALDAAGSKLPMLENGRQPRRAALQTCLAALLRDLEAEHAV